MLADRLRIFGASEITGKRLFADDMFASLHARDSHIGVQGRRGAKVDNVDIGLVEQVAPVATRMRNVELACKI